MKGRRDEETIVKYMLSEPPVQKETKKKKTLTILHYCHTKYHDNRVHLSSVEGHPTQAVISDQA